MKTQRGMALVTVLLIIALMTIIAVTVQREWVKALKLGDAQQFSRQAQWTLQGAEAWLLQQNSSVIDNKVQQIRLDEWLVNYRWRDRQHCFNVSALGQSGRMDEKGQYHPTAAQRVFAQLLMQQGVAKQEAVRILQQIQSQLNPGGGKQWPVLSDKSELRTLPVFSSARWTAIAPLLCALPDRALRINVNALSVTDVPLLMALLDGNIDVNGATELIKRRPDEGWPTLDAFFSALEGDFTSAVTTVQSIAVTEGLHWELHLWLTYQDYFAALRSQLMRTRDTFTLQHRQFGLSEAP